MTHLEEWMADISGCDRDTIRARSAAAPRPDVFHAWLYALAYRRGLTDQKIHERFEAHGIAAAARQKGFMVS